MTRRQKAIIGVFIMALAAMMVDRLVLGTGSDSAQASHMMAGAPVASSMTNRESDPCVPNLAERIDMLWSVRNVTCDQARDALAVPHAWLNALGGKEETSPSLDAATRFAANHTLKAIVVEDGAIRVVVDDLVVALGKSLAGFVLVEVREDSAVFESAGSRAVLTLEKDR